jgi:hypothetical protein
MVAEGDALKRLQAQTAVELDVFPPSPRLRWTGLPAIPPPSPGFDAAGGRDFKGES